MSRLPLLTVIALVFLRLVVGLHFFLEGLSHLRDPDWSSAGFRKAAVGPWADFFRASLPQVGDWSGTVGKIGSSTAAESLEGWQKSVVASWKRWLDDRRKAVPLDEKRLAAAEASVAEASEKLADYATGIAADVEDYRLQVARLAEMKNAPVSNGPPFARSRVTKKTQELASLAAGWQKDAEAIGNNLVAEWDDQLSPPERSKASAAVPPSPLWRADRFVSWSLLTIGACLILGIFVKFNAMGGVLFLASVIASQPFWVAGAQPTYDQWVEAAALLTLASMPFGGWCGLDYFLVPRLCRSCGCSGTRR